MPLKVMADPLSCESVNVNAIDGWSYACAPIRESRRQNSQLCHLRATLLKRRLNRRPHHQECEGVIEEEEEEGL